MLNSATGLALILLGSLEGVGLEGRAWCGRDRGQKLSGVNLASTRRVGATYSVLSIDSRLQVFTLDHHSKLFVDGLPGWHEGSIQAIEGYAREGNKVLDDTLAPNQVV